MEKQQLVKTKNWDWRTNEISYAEFGRMDIDNKNAHLEFLSNLGEDELSTNDCYILRQYGKYTPPNVKVSKTFSIKELEEIEKKIISTRFVEDKRVDKIKLVEEDISKMDAAYIRAILDKVFYNYTQWVWDIRSTTIDKFIFNTMDEYDYTEYEIELLHQFYKL
ncbi:hypothetical protein UFOVP1479_16 [uncultured Caudovirales phage]|uniref:Uncharacterized protein n=1 Tax=uncultured Caudovirales phage TaxID=2100421 RepID=A0A6J7XFX8_9CAUD|nr:hypothetical protein UFOVP310_18 [uncultured Caudovirales phage]CAB4152765.1 hypothetical protein UFOVP619_35 [uncultured Caudovirales phage]CAB4172948.1 hypothetical protein UFOVP947_19 [uncultured Caudovirales phage]CAB4184717.1 hypothetical protein UFOVP1114_31 [uncultured Caudovirales phage]CAB4204216.1 hypothetical protein UFOVP1386_31 [uncultured Caudovirales phage]|tara:strand:- start:33 stop:524 length:492 start_codon:yes stop_codon:yes gene_type:complete